MTRRFYPEDGFDKNRHRRSTAIMEPISDPLS